MTLTQALAVLADLLPTTAANYTAIATQSIKEAVRYASPRYRETTYQDFIGLDGVSRRFALVGRDVQLLPPPLQTTPTAVDTAGVSAPTTAPALVAVAGGGSLTAGLWYGASSWTTPLGETECSPVGSVTVAASGKVRFPAVTFPTNVTGKKDYLGVGPLSADIRLVGSPSTGAQVDYGTAGSVSNAMPLMDYVSLASLGPAVETEGGIDLSELASTTLTTLTVDTAPAAGVRFRVWYTRRPLVPASGSDVINVPDEWVTVVALYYTCQFLMLNHQGGDTTRFGAVASALAPLVARLLDTAASRDLPRIRATTWSLV